MASRDERPHPGDASGEPLARPGRRGRRVVGALVYTLLIVVVLAGGAAVAARLIQTGPKAERRRPKQQAQLVEVEAVRPVRERVRVQAMGSVRAAGVVDLHPRVSGAIVELSKEFLPGGRLQAGEEIAKIDPDDYELAVEQQRTEVARLAAMVEQRTSEVAQRESEIAGSQSAIEQRESDILQRESDIIEAEAALTMEQGQQAVAQREYELLGRTVSEEDRDLVLRQPQLRTAQATCSAARAAKRAAEAAKRAAEAATKSAEALKRSAEAAVQAAQASKAAAEVALRKAELDLRRTTIRAPFSATVAAKAVDEGSQVSPTTPLGRLVGTDEYWVEVSVPVDQLRWIRIPRTQRDEGSAVRIHNEAAWGKDAARTGSVIRLDSALEEEGRMARLLVSLRDPLALRTENHGKPVLLLGSYVRVEIDGEELDGVFPIDRDLMHDGDSVWVMTPEGKLDVRKVEVAFRGRDRVLVASGLKPGEHLVTTDLAAPVPGMPLRTRPSDEAASAEQGAPEKTPARPAEGSQP